MSPPLLSRRQFIGATAAALLAPKFTSAAGVPEPIIDIHQHTNYGGRPNRAPRTHDQLIAQQGLYARLAQSQDVAQDLPQGLDPKPEALA
jgi:hypothetical protein